MVKKLICLLSFVVLFSAMAFAYRVYPEVKPVIYQGIKYVVADSPKVATIEAWDLGLNIMLWDMRVYNPEEFYRKNIGKDNFEVEPDAMWSLIESLRIEGESLIVTNEAGEEYRVDLKTKNIVKLKEASKIPNVLKK